MAYHKPIPRFSWDNLPLTLTIKMAAELMHFSEPTIRTMCRNGEIKATRGEGRRKWVISRDVLKEYIEGEQKNARIYNDADV